MIGSMLSLTIRAVAVVFVVAVVVVPIVLALLAALFFLPIVSDRQQFPPHSCE